MSRETHDGLPRIRDVCADESEVLALAIARFVGAGYMTADVACWEAAYDATERLVGPTEGSRLVAAVTGVMRAIRAERSADWCFLPATCCRVTADEHRLLALVTLALQGRSAEVRSEAAHLAGAGERRAWRKRSARRPRRWRECGRFFPHRHPLRPASLSAPAAPRGAEAAYIAARPPYEEIEVLAASFPERDAAIGAHPYAFAGGETDHGFKGFHKVEALLFRDEDLAAALPVTEELEGSLAALVEDLQARETFSAKKTFEELLALSTEFGAKKISSEEETWSDRSLLIFRHNFLGIESQFRPFAPEVARRRLQAAEAARHAYRQAMAAVDAVYGPEPDGRPYSGVRTADRRAIARGTYACRDALAASAEVLGLA